METLTYVKNKALATVARTVVSATAYMSSKNVPARPDETVQIPSRDASRTIKAHLYSPSTETSIPSPVLINFHGSGFMLPMHGSDDAFCRYISQNSPYTVIDVAYRLAPENPFPAALNDVEDSVTWVLENIQSRNFDVSRIAVSGFSAGATLALAISSSGLFPPKTFSSVVAFYPPTDLATDPALKIAPDTTGRPIPTRVARLFNQCYMPTGVDPRDPRVSPTYADAESFPDRILLITCALDNLAVEAEELAKKIAVLKTKTVVSRRMEECGHGWNLSANEGTVQEKAKWEAYALVLETLDS